METRLRHHKQKEEHLAGMSPENFTASPLSGDEAADVSTPSPPRKSTRYVISRKGGEKRVVSVPTVGGDGSRGKAEVYPPPDSWSWRKYGQKPIKGSPYPRGYYRCSSSKGCPARKQVERSRLDPTTILLTYSSTHNHPPPTKTHHHTTAVATVPASDPVPPPSPDLHIFADPDPEIDCFREIAGDLGWFPDVGSRFVEIPAAGSVLWRDADVALMLPVGEEDQPLFGDLGELPECSVVFRRATFETPCFAAGTG
ncbi:hypothetical protein DM860_003780 [Cuscuta australis]|uniref:WRKY domain-containing protein n=1 Tax=Cuscuta australis TaxID=267555 RepID=A0A328DLH7_9ASTE|nr:hypothetical protein DM860_003780 [Cuscuta australis]